MARLPTIVSESSASVPAYSPVAHGSAGDATGLMSLGGSVQNFAGDLYKVQQQRIRQTQEDAYQDELLRMRNWATQKEIDLKSRPYSNEEYSRFINEFAGEMAAVEERFSKVGLDTTYVDRFREQITANQESLRNSFAMRKQRDDVLKKEVRYGATLSDGALAFYNAPDTITGIAAADQFATNAAEFADSYTNPELAAQRREGAAAFLINLANNPDLTDQDRSSLFLRADFIAKSAELEAQKQAITNRFYVDPTPPNETVINNRVENAAAELRRSGDIDAYSRSLQETAALIGPNKKLDKYRVKMQTLVAKNTATAARWASRPSPDFP